jgi:hypothetical protein
MASQAIRPTPQNPERKLGYPWYAVGNLPKVAVINTPASAFAASGIR